MKPDPGKPDVRNFRGDTGNVAYGARASVLPDHQLVLGIIEFKAVIKKVLVAPADGEFFEVSPKITKGVS